METLMTSLLAQFWLLSGLGLSVAIAGFVVLLSYRWWTNKKHDAQVLRKRQLRNLMLDFLESPYQELPNELSISTQDTALLLPVLHHLMQVMTMHDQQKVAEFLQRIGVPEALGLMLGSKRSRQRFIAYELLGLCPVDEQSLVYLRHGLANEATVEGRLIIAESLISIKDVDSYESILDMVCQLEGYSEFLIYEIAKRLMPTMETQMMSKLTLASLPVNVYGALLRCLSLAETQEAIKILEQHALEGQEDIQLAALFALTELQRPANDQLLGLAEHVNWRIRKQLASLMKHSEVLPVTAIIQLLGDSNWLVVVEAATTVFSFGNAGDKLLQVLAKDNHKLGQRAAKILIEYHAGQGEVNYA